MEEYIESDIFRSESSCSSEQSIFHGENHSIISDYIECRVTRLFYILLFFHFFLDIFYDILKLIISNKFRKLNDINFNKWFTYSRRIWWL